MFEVVVKDQRLLHSWDYSLKRTGGDLKLSKCYWNLQGYLWQDRVFTKSTTASETMNVHNNNSNTTIKNVSTDNIRMLVGVPIKPSNECKNIVLF